MFQRLKCWLNICKKTISKEVLENRGLYLVTKYKHQCPCCGKGYSFIINK